MDRPQTPQPRLDEPALRCIVVWRCFAKHPGDSCVARHCRSLTERAHLAAFAAVVLDGESVAEQGDVLAETEKTRRLVAKHQKCAVHDPASHADNHTLSLAVFDGTEVGRTLDRKRRKLPA